MTEVNSKEKIAINFQLISKLDTKAMEKSNSDSKKDEANSDDLFYLNQNKNKNKNIIDIKEISKNYIGILLDNNSFSIYNTKTFNKINEIKFNVPKSEEKNNNNYYRENDEEIVYNFIVLKNSDLVFWTIKRIFFYKLSGKENEYVLYKTMEETYENSQKEDFDFYFGRNYSNLDEPIINSVYELKNGNLITCISTCMKIYTKKNENYTFLSKIDTDTEIKKVFEVKPNQIILMQKNYEAGGHCSQTYYCIHTFSLSLYDIEKNLLTKLNKFEERVSLKYNDISFFNNDKYLFIKYGGFKFDIFDINQNMQSINSNNEIIQLKTIEEIYGFFRKRTFNVVIEELNIRFLCNYNNDLFFAKDLNGNIKLYKFKGKSFEFYQDFPLSTKDIIGIIKLKDNKLIMYSRQNAFIINAS